MIRKDKRTQEKRSTKGITLIALVVTIVVLLILAGVTINAILGDNGIIAQARRAADAAKEAAENDERSLADLSEQINSMIEGGSVPPSGTGEKTLVQMFNAGELKVGDYVDYKNPTGVDPVEVGKEETGYDKTQTYSVDSNTTWRVLGLSKDGQNLLLVSGSPIKRSKEDGKATTDPYLAMGGAESYINGDDTLDKICSIYKNDSLATEARSMTMEDVLSALEITVDKTNHTATYKDGQQVMYQDFFGQSKTYDRNNSYFCYSPENYMKDTYGASKYPGEYKKTGDTIDGTAYMIMPMLMGNSGSPSQSSFNSNNTNVKIEKIAGGGAPSGTLLDTPAYHLLFDGTTEEDNYVKSYWLASSGVSFDGSYALFGPGCLRRLCGLWWLRHFRLEWWLGCG